jgi:predicted ATP-grasp superfamily ATP-dependent carboligase
MANSNRGNLDAPPRLNIVGASARSAAFSAIRAGFLPLSADIFGDADLLQTSPFEGRAVAYPDDFRSALRKMVNGPFLYTGGLENHPELVDDLARLRPLWGNSGSCLRQARDPFLLARVVSQAGAAPPKLRRFDDPPKNPDGWLRKPLRGSGGFAIESAASEKHLVAPSKATDTGSAPWAYYYQSHVKGETCSSVHVASTLGCRLLGVTRQLVGMPWLYAKPFAWCGNIGPRSIPAAAKKTLEQVGVAASEAFGLQGLFGIDFLLDGTTVRPVELNPRYTASTEILEHALGLPALRLHADAFVEPGARPEITPKRKAGILGKAVLYAPESLVTTTDLVVRHPPDPCRFPTVADIPAQGTEIMAGRPLITLFECAETAASCEAALRSSAENILYHFQGGGSGI